METYLILLVVRVAVATVVLNEHAAESVAQAR